MKRNKLTKRGSKRLFKKTAMMTNKRNINVDKPSRGGIRM